MVTSSPAWHFHVVRGQSFVYLAHSRRFSWLYLQPATYTMLVIILPYSMLATQFCSISAENTCFLITFSTRRFSNYFCSQCSTTAAVSTDVKGSSSQYSTRRPRSSGNKRVLHTPGLESYHQIALYTGYLFSVSWGLTSLHRIPSDRAGTSIWWIFIIIITIKLY